MNGVIEAAEAEERELVAALHQNPTYKKLVAVRNLLSVYRPKASGETPAPPPPRAAPAPTLPAPRRALGAVATISNAARIRSVVSDHLRRVGRRATSGELLEVAGAAGIRIGGAKPNAVMASYLSGMKEFDNVAGEGYGLAEWGTKPRE